MNRLGSIIDRLLVKTLIVFLGDTGVIGLAFGVTTIRDNFNSGCIGNVRQIVGGGARKVIERG